MPFDNTATAPAPGVRDMINDPQKNQELFDELANTVSEWVGIMENYQQESGLELDFLEDLKTAAAKIAQYQQDFTQVSAPTNPTAPQA